MDPFISDRLARLDTVEGAWSKKIFRALIKDLELVFQVYSTTGNIDLASAVLPTRHIKGVLDAMFLAIIVQEAEYEYKHLVTKEVKAGLPIADWLFNARTFVMTRGAAAIKAIADNTRNEVRRVLNAALADGASIPVVTQRLRTASTDLSRLRATTIARTELISSANYGSISGARSTGLQLDKIWLSTTDNRTRASHAVANGQVVGIDGLFVIGGQMCHFPGDSSLSAGERVRCRCTITYKVKR